MEDRSRIIPPPDATASGRGLLTFPVDVQQLPDGTPVVAHIQAVILVDKQGNPFDLRKLTDALENFNENVERLIEAVED